MTNNLLTDFQPRFTTQTEFSAWYTLFQNYAVGWSVDEVSTRETDQHAEYVALPFP